MMALLNTLDLTPGTFQCIVSVVMNFHFIIRRISATFFTVVGIKAWVCRLARLYIQAYEQYFIETYGATVVLIHITSYMGHHCFPWIIASAVAV